MKFCLRITVKIPSNRIMPVSILNMRNLGVLLVLVDIVGKLCKTDILISSTLPRPGLPEPVWGQPSTHKHWRKRKSSHKIHSVKHKYFTIWTILLKTVYHYKTEFKKGYNLVRKRWGSTFFSTLSNFKENSFWY